MPPRITYLEANSPMEDEHVSSPTLRKILLVDDDETTNYINQRVLKKANIAQQIDIVTNGEEALRYLKEGAGSQAPPELMFVDIKMSVMDGFEFLDKYQFIPASQKAQKLIMLSSSASFYDLHKLKQYPDVVQHIAKPLNAAHVKELMDKYFPSSS